MGYSSGLWRMSSVELARNRRSPGRASPTRSLERSPSLRSGRLAADLYDNEVALVLIADSLTEARFALEGFRLAKDFYLQHMPRPDTPRRPAAPWWKMSVFDSLMARILRWSHVLYRPYYDPDQPRARFHVGVLAEVAYSPEYSIYFNPTDRKFARADPNASLRFVSSEQFCWGMYIRAEICGFDRVTGKYELHYVDGPYRADQEAVGVVLWKQPNGKRAAIHLSDVHPVHITVDMSDNYSSNWPLAVLVLVLAQAGFFLVYAFLFMSSHSFPPGAREPVVGPRSLFMRVVAQFPGCRDARLEVWRLLSYQLIHAGYLHLAANLFFQLVFGLPINMVHGNLRFMLLYQLGVVGGALCYAVLGGGHFSLVGASGGVYSIFGMHFAELLLNWDSQKKGFFNHWTRAAILFLVMALDLYSYYNSPSETTSYAAHAGGWLVGCIFGVIFMQNFEVQWYERWILLPLAKLSGLLLALFLVGWYVLVFPPDAAFIRERDLPCCHQLLECEDLDRKDFASLFRCVDDGTEVLSAATNTVLSSCSDFEAEVG